MLAGIDHASEVGISNPGEIGWLNNRYTAYTALLGAAQEKLMVNPSIPLTSCGKSVFMSW